MKKNAFTNVFLLFWEEPQNDVYPKRCLLGHCSSPSISCESTQKLNKDVAVA